MRFFDICLVNELIYPDIEEEIIIFDASEIANNIDMVDSEKHPDFSSESFGKCAPPFVDKYFWIEATSVIDYDAIPDSDIEFYKTVLRKRGHEESAIEFILKKDHGATVRRAALLIAKINDNKDSVIKWFVSLNGIYQSTKKGANPFTESVYSSRAVALLGIDHDGFLVTNSSRVPIYVHESVDAGDEDTHSSLTTNTIPFALFALSYLHQRTEVDLIVPNRQERKNANRIQGKRRGAAVLRSYYMIKVAPHNVGETVTAMADVHPLTNTPSKAKHCRRGHFRHVGPAGLFGKGYYADSLVWISDSNPGDRSKGVIQKGYTLMG